MFELQILTANIVVPALAFIGALLASRQVGKRYGAALESAGLAVSAAAAIQLAYGLRNGWSLWPEDAWQRIPVVTLLVAGVAAATEYWLPAIAKDSTDTTDSTVPSSAVAKASLFTAREIGVWSIRAAAILCAAFAIFPSGESWVELQAARTSWLAAITLSVTLAWLAASRLAHAVTPALGFALIPWTVAAAVLSSQSFMKVTEPMLAIAAILGLSSLFDWYRLRTVSQARAIVAVLGPLHFAAAAAVAHGKFYSFLELPDVLYVGTLFVPVIVASAMLVSTAVDRSGKSRWLSPSVAIVVSITLSAFVLYHTLR